MRLVTSPRELFAAAAASRDTDDDDTDDDYGEPASTGGRLGLRGGGKQGKSMAPQAWGGLKQVSLSCLFFLFFDRHTSRSAPSPAGLVLGRLGGWMVGRVVGVKVT